MDFRDITPSDGLLVKRARYTHDMSAFRKVCFSSLGRSCSALPRSNSVAPCQNTSIRASRHDFSRIIQLFSGLSQIR